MCSDSKLAQLAKLQIAEIRRAADAVQAEAARRDAFAGLAGGGAGPPRRSVRARRFIIPVTITIGT